MLVMKRDWYPSLTGSSALEWRSPHLVYSLHSNFSGLNKTEANKWRVIPTTKHPTTAGHKCSEAAYALERQWIVCWAATGIRENLGSVNNKLFLISRLYCSQQSPHRKPKNNNHPFLYTANLEKTHTKIFWSKHYFPSFEWSAVISTVILENNGYQLIHITACSFLSV